MKLHRVLASGLLACLVLTTTAFAQAGPPGGTIYVHDVAYRTIGTPADLPDHGRFDHIYVLGDGLGNVADAAPGDHDYNGGRWEVRAVQWETIPPTQFTNVEDLLNAANAGEISIGPVIRRFECPLIRGRGPR
jgi:hypothetical protein